MSVAMDLKRKRPERPSRKPPSKSKRLKQINAYHSSSEDEALEGQDNQALNQEQRTDSFATASLKTNPTARQRNGEAKELPRGADEASMTKPLQIDSDEDSEDVDEDEDEDSTNASSSEASSDMSSRDAGGIAGRKPRKRNDPAAFATSMSKILDSKLSSSKRADPVLSRSRDASAVAKELSESKLDAKARRKLREEKVASKEKGRVRDVLGLNTTDVSTGDVLEEEKMLKKLAQRGVVKLFNAVRAAQVKGEQAAKEAFLAGTVGMDQRQEKVNEMSKKGFLDLLVEGGQK